MLHGDQQDEQVPQVIDQEDMDDSEELRLTPMKRTTRDAALTSPHRKQRRIVDDDDEFLYGEEPVDGELEDEDDEPAIEEEDEESFSLPTGSRRKIKEVRKQAKSGARNSKGKRGVAKSAQKPRRAKSDFIEDGDGLDEEEMGDNNCEIEGDSEDEEDPDEDEDGVHQAAGDETVFIDNLPNDEFDIRRMLKDVRKHIKQLEKQFFEEEDSEKEDELKKISNVAKHEEALAAFKEHAHLKQFWCIPLSVNVTNFNFDKLGDSQIKSSGRLFDVITIDPPWQLSSANPTRGVAIAYDTLNDKEILNIPFDKIQSDGFLFIWVINAKYRMALDMMKQYNYRLVDEIAWVKQTVNGKIAKGHGYYL